MDARKLSSIIKWTRYWLLVRSHWPGCFLWVDELHVSILVLLLKHHDATNVLSFLVCLRQDDAALLLCKIRTVQFQGIHSLAILCNYTGNCHMAIDILLFVDLPEVLCVVICAKFLLGGVLSHIHHEGLLCFIIDVRVQIILLDTKALGRHHRDHWVRYWFLAKLVRRQEEVLDVLKILAKTFILAKLSHL